MATLDRYLQTKGRLSPPQAARVTLEVVRKMIGTGDHGVVHPGRISIGQDRSVSLVTEDRTLPVAIELPAYASPELIQGGGHSEASALYSLGCTFFELLAGSPPFSSADPKETLKAHLESPPPALGDLVPGVPDVLARVVDGLLGKSPAERGSLKDLESRLVRALGSGQKQPTPNPGAPGAARAAAPVQPAGSPSKAGSSRAGSGKAVARPPEQRPKAAAGRPGARARKPGGPGLRAGEGEPGRGRVSAKASGKRGRAGASMAGSSMAGSSRLRRGGRRTASPGYDEELDQGERGHVIAKRRKTYPLSLLGALLGLVIGALFVFQGAQRARQRPEAIAQRKEQDIVAERENRKKVYRDEYQQRGKDVTAFLARTKGIDTAEQRYEWLVKGMDEHFSSPRGRLLATAVFKALEERDREREHVEEGAAEDSEFTRIKTLAQSLYDQGRLGDSYNKMSDAYQDFKNQHGEEIDAFIMKVSAELDDRWGKDKATIEKHLERSEPALAIKLLKTARDYGDADIRSEVEASLSQVQEILLIQSPDGEEGTEDEVDFGDDDDEEADEEEKDDDWDDGDEEEEKDDDWDDDDDEEESDDDWDDWDDDEETDEEESDDDWDDDDDEEADEEESDDDWDDWDDDEEADEDWDDDWDDDDDDEEDDDDWEE